MNFFMKNRYSDPDPDPRQNEMDPKRSLKQKRHGNIFSFRNYPMQWLNLTVLHYTAQDLWGEVYCTSDEEDSCDSSDDGEDGEDWGLSGEDEDEDEEEDAEHNDVKNFK